MTSLIFVLGFNGWMVYARMTRGVVLSAKERPYVEAAEMIGCRPKRVMFTHILPNLTRRSSTLAVLEFARIILAEATLSFLGLGLQFPEVSLGRDGQQRPRRLLLAPRRLAIIPGVAITLHRARGQLPRLVAASGAPTRSSGRSGSPRAAGAAAASAASARRAPGVDR